MTQHGALSNLMSRGSQFLGCRHAIMAGAMTWVSERSLVSAISNAGGFGVLACGSMTPELLDQEIKQTQYLTKQPFGVNLIVMHPQLDALADVCVANKVSHVVLAGGTPKKSMIERLQVGGCKVLAFAPALVIGKRLINNGIDALIIEGSEAGGHIGAVSTSVLAQEILPHIHDVPVFVAGGIGRGEAIAGYLEMGASGTQLGTRFVCAAESIAHPKFKQAFIRAAARDAIASVQLDPRFPVIPVRAIQNQGTKRFVEIQRQVIAKYDCGELTMENAQLEIEHYWAGALRRAVIDGDVEQGSLMAGQSVGMITHVQSVAEIISELIAQAESKLVQNCAA